MLNRRARRSRSDRFGQIKTFIYRLSTSKSRRGVDETQCSLDDLTMWMKVDNTLINHPKMFEAGRHLGQWGRQRAFSIYMEGLSWVNLHLTDGRIPTAAVRSFSIDRDPIEVARVLALKTVRLWEKTAAGFSIHDYHDHNPDAIEVKDKLQRDRDRKRAERKEKHRSSIERPRGQVVDAPVTRPTGLRAESPALARARSRSRSPVQAEEKSTGASAPVFPRALDRPTHRQLCALLRDIRTDAPDIGGADLKELLKVRCAQLRWDYFSDHGLALQRALDASDVATAKRRAS